MKPWHTPVRQQGRWWAVWPLASLYVSGSRSWHRLQLIMDGCYLHAKQHKAFPPDLLWWVSASFRIMFLAFSRELFKAGWDMSRFLSFSIQMASVLAAVYCRMERLWNRPWNSAARCHLTQMTVKSCHGILANWGFTVWNWYLNHWGLKRDD